MTTVLCGQRFCSTLADRESSHSPAAGLDPDASNQNGKSGGGAALAHHLAEVREGHRDRPGTWKMTRGLPCPAR
jgi:hypothetical protein